MDQTAKDKNEIERMIDDYSVGTFLDLLADVCFEKADHVRTNWQDKATAKEWQRLGVRLGRATEKAGGRL